MTIRHQVFRATYPAFSAALSVPGVESLASRCPDWLAAYVMPYYMRWYERNVSYSPDAYREFQARYWNTVGQLRWASAFDYSDMLATLRKRLAPSDRTLMELGCGKGTMLAEIAALAPTLRLTGVDAAERMCQEALAQVPGATIIHRCYGPGLQVPSADVVIARSTLTYVDEADIANVLAWICSVTTRLLVISEPSGVHDEQAIAANRLRVTQLGGGVYKRTYDHTHIRDYAARPLPGFELVETSLERAQNHGNRQWVFVRVPAA